MNQSNDVERVIDACKNGRIFAIIDDEDRENECDLCIASSSITYKQVGYLSRYCAPDLCVAIEPQRCDELGLVEIVTESTDPNGTPIRTPIDLAKQHGTTTGISWHDMALTMNGIGNSRFQSKDFTRPGHVKTLCASVGGLSVRNGHTEASVCVGQLANLKPAAVVIAELLVSPELLESENESDIPADIGRAMTGKKAIEWCKQRNIPLVSVAALKAYTNAIPPLPIRVIESIVGPIRLPFITAKNVTHEANVFYIRFGSEKTKYLCLVRGDVRRKEHVFLRVHSECKTGDLFDSARCDCGSQLKRAKQELATRDIGILVYVLGHEGRGIGLVNKLRAYEIMDADSSIDTYVANEKLGLPHDSRNFSRIGRVLELLGVKSVILHTNNVSKIDALGSIATSNESFFSEHEDINIYNQSYVATKMKHSKMKYNGNGNGNTNTKPRATSPVNEPNRIEPRLLSNGTNSHDTIMATTQVVLPNTIAKPLIRPKPIIGLGVAVEWHTKYIPKLTADIRAELEKLGAQICVLEVLGSGELGLAARVLGRGEYGYPKCDAVIVIGALKHGETGHCEYIAGYVSQMLSRLCTDAQAPVNIINGLLVCPDDDTIAARTIGDLSSAKYLARNAVSMANVSKGTTPYLC